MVFTEIQLKLGQSTYLTCCHIHRKICFPFVQFLHPSAHFDKMMYIEYYYAKFIFTHIMFIIASRITPIDLFFTIYEKAIDLDYFISRILSEFFHVNITILISHHFKIYIFILFIYLIELSTYFITPLNF